MKPSHDNDDDDTVQCLVLCFNDTCYDNDTNDGNGDDDAVDLSCMMMFIIMVLSIAILLYHHLW
jgi:hypothetical protein